MKFREHLSVLWLSIQIFISELQLKWLAWRLARGEKKSRRCLEELQSAKMDDDTFAEWIPLIKAMNPDIPEGVFLGEGCNENRVC